MSFENGVTQNGVTPQATNGAIGGSKEPAISVRGLGKKYSIARNAVKHTTLAEAAVHRLKNPLQKVVRDEFWALQDMDFDVEQGEVVGVIGRNGAGKSTLLKVMSQITEPTTGEIALYGRVGSLLEVGTGFHPELTGRENIFLNGAILGMTRREIQKSFDQIVAFSGVEKFLETPVKRYSSGMYVRLAFAVAAHLSTEILVVDEVLAVGDAEFQRKCLGKIRDVAQSGRTVLFVSHHMQSVAVLCTKAMFLEKGRILHYGSVEEGIRRYVESMALGQNDIGDPTRRPGSGELRFTHFGPTKETFACGEPKTIDFTVEHMAPYAGKFFVSLHVVDAQGVVVAQCDSRLTGTWFDAEGTTRARFTLTTPWLKPGSYTVNAFLCASGVLDRFEGAAQLHVIPLLPYPTAGSSEATAHGIVFADFGFQQLNPATEVSLETTLNGRNGYAAHP